ncbi:MAG: sugar ABC transporter substrate-binding protein [Mycobacteriales bacterium]
MSSARRWAVTALLVPITIAGAVACGSSNSNKKADATKTSSGAKSTGLTFDVITHGAAGDAFWSVVKNGANQAGTDMGIKVNYENDGQPAKQSQLINAAVNQKVDGLVISMADPGALKAAVTGAVKAGIPVITINSGGSDSAAFGAITHVGQDEEVAGEGAGTKLKAAGAKHILCVIHEAGNVGLEQRCQGAAKTFGGTVTNLQVDINNLQQAAATIKAKVSADSSVDGILALNPAVATTAVGALGSTSKVKVATFDLSADVTKDIEGGKILFAVDQQQYLQGYLPITLLKLYISNDNTLGGGKPVLTGPGFVTKANASKVAALAKKGTR